MIRLEHFGRQDFDLLISWIDSPEFLMQWAGTDFSYPLDEEQLNQYVKGANEENSTVYLYKVIFDETGETIGHISLNNINLKNCSANIGKVLIGNTRCKCQPKHVHFRLFKNVQSYSSSLLR